MKTKFFLNVRAGGSVRATKTQVALHTDEVAIGMEIELPDRLFQKPIIQGKITVSEDMVNPKEITADVKEAIKNAIDSVDAVRIELIYPEEE